MAVLHDLSPLVEPLSLDEAYVDLSAAGQLTDLSPAVLFDVAEGLRREVSRVTGGLTASVGIGSSKLVAKIASELDKPDGVVVVIPGTERDLLRPMQVTVIPGVGPATGNRLRMLGVTTIDDLERLSVEELVRVLGQAHGRSLFALARGEDDRAVMAERESKSISVEDTFDTDLVEPALLSAIVDRHARAVCERLVGSGLSGRTVTIKVRQHDFTTNTRSTTLAGPTDRAAVVSRVARELLREIDTSAGVRLLGVGVSGLADWVQDDLFVDDEPPEEPVAAAPTPVDVAGRSTATGWVAGMDVEHDDFGPGWVWGAGLGRVTVRFETAETGVGPVRTLAADDNRLRRRPLPAPDPA